MANAIPSLASVTGTRTDSASKHIRVCRVGQDYICNWLGRSEQDLKSDKLKFAVQRDDFFIGCGKPLFDTSNGCFNNKKPYAIGLGHLHGQRPVVMQLISLINHVCITQRDFFLVCRGLTKFLNKNFSDSDADIKAIRGIPDFYMGGVALTVGYPHGNIGDTALSVLTGGMMTVMNGPFEINPGDTCTWIWHFELPQFDDKVKAHRKIGTKKENYKTVKTILGDCFGINPMLHDTAIVTGPVGCNDFLKELHKITIKMEDLRAHDINTKRRKVHFDEQMRVINKNSSNNSGKHDAIPLLIPMPENASYMDRKRAFGKCMMSARPYEKTDVKLCNQGL